MHCDRGHDFGNRVVLRNLPARLAGRGDGSVTVRARIGQSVTVDDETTERLPRWQQRLIAAVIVAGVVGVNAATYAGLRHADPHLSLRPTAVRSAAPVGAAPLPQPVAAVTKPRPVAPASVAAATVSAIAGAVPSVFGRSWTVQPATDALYAAPFGHGCLPTLPGAATPLLSAARVARGAGAGAGVSVWVYGAGQAGAALAALRQQLSGCAPAPAIADGPVGGADGFTASRSTDGMSVQWIVWQRGDVLLSVSYSALTTSATAPASMLQALDAAATAALTPVCPQLRPDIADARRNPASPDYQPYTHPVTVTVTAAPAITPAPAPAVTPLPEPAAQPHPELAPPLLPPASAYLDTNHDGFAETPPPLTSALHGPAPVFADPAQFTAPPAAAIPATAAPTEPNAAPASATVAVPDADATGPGCGWSFTGQAPPAVDVATITQTRQKTLTQILVQLTAGQAQYAADERAWADAYARWSIQDAQQNAYTAWARDRDAATAAAAAAKQAYDAAVARYLTPRTPPAPRTPAAPATGSSPTPSATPSATPSPGVTR